MAWFNQLGQRRKDWKQKQATIVHQRKHGFQDPNQLPVFASETTAEFYTTYNSAFQIRKKKISWYDTHLREDIK
jgi:hypothetical protein